jgi:hypothetical protein
MLSNLPIMTAQVKEQIIIDGIKYGMVSDPLAPYLKTLNPRPIFTLQNTACWRGYMGTWEIMNNKLYLKDFTALIYNQEENNDHEHGIEYLFPDHKRVLAHWFSGEIQVPKGRIMDFEPGIMNPQYEYDLFLNFENGKLIGERLVDNTESALSSQEKLSEARKGILQRLAGVFSNATFSDN